MRQIRGRSTNNNRVRGSSKRLPVNVSLLDPKTKATVKASTVMPGFLRDISKKGLSLIMPFVYFGDPFLMCSGYLLLITIEFPNRTVHIQAAPVRYNIDESQEEQKYLIGARIVQITKSDRRYIDQYINSGGVMPEAINSLVRRMYGTFVNYTRTRRSGMRLPLNAALFDTKAKDVAAQAAISLSGFLYDISKTGLSLVVPSARFGSRYPIGSNYILRIMIQLPNRAVNIQATPVRYNHFDEISGERTYLVGARIMQMSAADRRHLIRHIRQLKKRTPSASETSFAHDASFY
ncbi:MAG TPA: PilZ domain-containing protein [Pyrinomonadaceae bacterium]